MNKEYLVYGLELKGLSTPFSIGKLTIYPHFDLAPFLNCFDSDKVQKVIDSGALYANCKAAVHKEHNKIIMHLGFGENADLSFTAIRLFKAGWILPKSVMPVKELGGITTWEELDEPPFGQNWAEPMNYTVNEKAVEQIQVLHQKLISMPLDYLRVALRRFNRSYDYEFYPDLDDCLVDLVIALESMLSRGGDGILQSMKLRGSLLCQ